jgi:hypothetical protein
MIKVILTEQQFNSLLGCIDITLRKNGLSSLGTVVDLHNVLIAAKENYEHQRKEDLRKDEKQSEERRYNRRDDV